MTFSTAGRVAGAEAELAHRHPVMAGLIARCGPCTLASGRRRGVVESHFEALASSIVYQQLAGAAAGAIWARVRALAPGGFTAEAVLALGPLGPRGAYDPLNPEPLRAAGLSWAKAASLEDLARRVVEGSLDLDRVATLADEEVVEELSAVRGIGRWTAQMFLIFRLGRLDVWPTGDLGVRRGYAVAHGLNQVPTPGATEALGEGFRPWRSVAAWYCWRAVDAGVPTDR